MKDKMERLAYFINVRSGNYSEEMQEFHRFYEEINNVAKLNTSYKNNGFWYNLLSNVELEQIFQEIMQKIDLSCKIRGTLEAICNHIEEDCDEN